MAKNEPWDKLYRAAEEYVRLHGGGAILAAGIECQRWPGDKPNEFRLAIKLVGKPPTAKDTAKGE